MRTAPVRRVTSPLRARLKAAVTRVARQEVQSLRPQIAELRREVDELHVSVDDDRYETVVDDDRLARALNELATARQTLDHVAKIQDENVATIAMVETHTRELSALVDSYRFSLELLLGPTGRYTPRFLTEADVDDLVRSFGWIDDQQCLVVALNAAYRTLIELELRCIGRFAGSTPNILAKLAAIAVVPLPSSEVLEIGTLFGVGAVGVARQISRTGADATLTVVDPFAGFQIQPHRGAELDVSYTPVTKTVIATNLALGGVSAHRYRLVEGRSDGTEVSARSAIDGMD